MELGPLQLVAVGFDSPSMDGSVLGELAAIRAQGMVRLVDALGVHKDEEGAVWSLEMSDLTDEQALFVGAAIGALIGLGAGGESEPQKEPWPLCLLWRNGESGVSPEDILDISGQIPTGGAALLMLVEHLWLIPLRDAIRAQGGVFLRTTSQRGIADRHWRSISAG